MYTVISNSQNTKLIRTLHFLAVHNSEHSAVPTRQSSRAMSNGLMGTKDDG